eukprot:Gregarina_sp_Poly_1__2387@NODE_163_length_12241_cov_147_232955_g145_i0_p2_GENE_NODE_163_length_12241_cov_147_232955_g145_i0NODE_163_length_12241_cov_147_232955_g145_i0_p2_ORF_typecomplete_len526_score72_30_NODE_163_length_12241_cov_147_232955_g145_i01063812215
MLFQPEYINEARSVFCKFSLSFVFRKLQKEETALDACILNMKGETPPLATEVSDPRFYVKKDEALFPQLHEGNVLPPVYSEPSICFPVPIDDEREQDSSSLNLASLETVSLGDSENEASDETNVKAGNSTSNGIVDAKSKMEPQFFEYEIVGRLKQAPSYTQTEHYIRFYVYDGEDLFMQCGIELLAAAHSAGGNGNSGTPLCANVRLRFRRHLMTSWKICAPFGLMGVDFRVCHVAIARTEIKTRLYQCDVFLEGGDIIKRCSHAPAGSSDVYVFALPSSNYDDKDRISKAPRHSTQDHSRQSRLIQRHSRLKNSLFKPADSDADCTPLSNNRPASLALLLAPFLRLKEVAKLRFVDTQVAQLLESRRFWSTLAGCPKKSLSVKETSYVPNLASLYLAYREVNCTSSLLSYRPCLTSMSQPGWVVDLLEDEAAKCLGVSPSRLCVLSSYEIPVPMEFVTVTYELSRVRAKFFVKGLGSSDHRIQMVFGSSLLAGQHITALEAVSPMSETSITAIEPTLQYHWSL